MGIVGIMMLGTLIINGTWLLQRLPRICNESLMLLAGELYKRVSTICAAADTTYGGTRSVIWLVVSLMFVTFHPTDSGGYEDFNEYSIVHTGGFTTPRVYR